MWCGPDSEAAVMRLAAAVAERVCIVTAVGPPAVMVHRGPVVSIGKWSGVDGTLMRQAWPRLDGDGGLTRARGVVVAGRVLVVDGPVSGVALARSSEAAETAAGGWLASTANDDDDDDDDGDDDHDDDDSGGRGYGRGGGWRDVDRTGSRRWGGDGRRDWSVSDAERRLGRSNAPAQRVGGRHVTFESSSADAAVDAIRRAEPDRRASLRSSAGCRSLAQRCGAAGVRLLVASHPIPALLRAALAAAGCATLHVTQRSTIEAIAARQSACSSRGSAGRAGGGSAFPDLWSALREAESAAGLAAPHDASGSDGCCDRDAAVMGGRLRMRVVSVTSADRSSRSGPRGATRGSPRAGARGATRRFLDDAGSLVAAASTDASSFSSRLEVTRKAARDAASDAMSDAAGDVPGSAGKAAHSAAGGNGSGEHGRFAVRASERHAIARGLRDASQGRGWMTDNWKEQGWVNDQSAGILLFEDETDGDDPAGADRASPGTSAHAARAATPGPAVKPLWALVRCATAEAAAEAAASAGRACRRSSAVLAAAADECGSAGEAGRCRGAAGGWGRAGGALEAEAAAALRRRALELRSAAASDAGRDGEADLFAALLCKALASEAELLAAQAAVNVGVEPTAAHARAAADARAAGACALSATQPALPSSGGGALLARMSAFEHAGTCECWGQSHGPHGTATAMDAAAHRRAGIVFAFELVETLVRVAAVVQTS